MSSNSDELIISLDDVSKMFPIYKSPHHRLLQMFSPPRDKARWYKQFWALRNISIDIPRGETIGIVGRNGSGKSTLLQVICGILSPTGGKVTVKGRIAALLELGAGFNPEFTGRENVFLNGTVLGLSREEIEARFDEIAAFADIGEYIDQPVKSYSSGMYVRLAFAVAIHVTPEILIVDEALSVGDEAFQRKCFARINALRDSGVTVLFVSHSAGIVTELCNRALLLDRGEIIALGSPREVVAKYHKLLFAPQEKVAEIRGALRRETQEGIALSDDFLGESLSAPESPGSFVQEEDSGASYLDEHMLPVSTVHYVNLGANIIDPHLETLSGRRVNVVTAEHDYIYTYDVHFSESAVGVRFGLMVKTVSGFEIGGGASALQQDAIAVIDRGTRIKASFRFTCRLAAGAYFLNAGVVGLVGEGETFLCRQVDAMMFRVMPDPNRLATGLVNLGIDPKIEFLSMREVEN
ncbi:ABC transporter ATP-binding protein [Dyella flagellata]|uniref:ABC transporter n=1 Tax=Dyella flagellata TaxID=1867833 RepID=A0ABQ5X8Y6_9GAMM|nr:ABC transporter ATP-binding protein [Dyella flagellata]GLQ88079.1 ABC transporter [Dyella flagellata]